MMKILDVGNAFRKCKTEINDVLHLANRRCGLKIEAYKQGVKIIVRHLHVSE